MVALQVDAIDEVQRIFNIHAFKNNIYHCSLYHYMPLLSLISFFIPLIQKV